VRRLTYSGRKPHPVLVGALAVTLLYGAVAAWRHAKRPPGRWVGITDCSWRGAPLVTIRGGLRPIDSVAAVAHESVHVAECRRLGPLQYRWQTLFPASNLALETPAYCAGARSRVGLDHDTAFIRATIIEDMTAAMADVVDSSTIIASVARECPVFLPPVRP
jgi:hypothetical protein